MTNFIQQTKTNISCKPQTGSPKNEADKYDRIIRGTDLCTDKEEEHGERVSRELLSGVDTANIYT